MIIEAKALQVAPVEWILHLKYLGRSKTELLQHVLETLLFSAIFTLVIWSVCSNVIGIYEFDPVGQRMSSKYLDNSFFRNQTCWE